MSHNESVFNYDWCDAKFHPEWAKWLEPDVKNVHNFRCLACSRTLFLSNMGVQAIISHNKGKKHNKKIKRIQQDADAKKQMSNFFLLKKKSPELITDTVTELPASTSTSSTLEEATTNASEDKSSSETFNTKVVVASGKSEKEIMKKYLIQDEVSKAEILWCLHTVMTHSSLRSNSDVADIFKIMFHDSDIARKFQLKKDKTAYTICFGLAPLFRNELSTILSALETYVISFDESLNKIVQNCQMDIHVTFWENNCDNISRRYLTSIFLGHSDANSLLDALQSVIAPCDMKKILQLGMDGPNVNHKLHSLLQTNLNEACNRSLLDIGSCGLHIVHGAFKTGHKSTLWNLHKFLYAVYNFFKDSPARRADYIHLTKSNTFPLKFCSIRWVESTVVAQRALDIIPNLRIFVQVCEAKKTEPDTKCYKTVKSMLQDSELLEAKLSFFISIANEVQGFLKKFQSSKPMAPFLYEEMFLMLHNLMTRFIKPDVLEKESSSASKLMKLDVNDASNVLHITKLNIGFAAKHALLNSKKASDAAKLNFKRECCSFLKNMTAKLIQRNPLNFRLVTGISFLSPIVVTCSSSSVPIQRLEVALDCFVSSGQMAAITADSVKSEFNNFIKSSCVKSEMSKFNHETDRLDVFYNSLMGADKKYAHLFKFTKNILIMSHGSAAVESGFSINKALLIENLRQKSVVALRTVYDAVHHAGGILKVEVTKKMVLAARNAHSYYREELAKKKLAEKEEEKSVSLKRKTEQELKELKAKKLKIQQDAEKKISELDKLIVGLPKL